MGQLVDIEDWGLTAADLPGLDNRAAVQINLTYPDYRTLVQYEPRERLRRIEAHYRHDYQRLLALLPPGEVERVSTARRPTGVKTRLPLHQLPALLQLDFIGTIGINDIEGRTRVEEEFGPWFWCVEARFAVQIENATKGLQLYEDRMLVVQAESEAEAKQKLTAGFAGYATPYLNPSGLLVRWQFEEFLDIYQLGPVAATDFTDDLGVEVFSRLRRRQLRPDREWHPRF